jgi:hypothetical protein
VGLTKLITFTILITGNRTDDNRGWRQLCQFAAELPVQFSWSVHTRTVDLAIIYQPDADHRLFQQRQLGAELPVWLSWSVHIRTVNLTVITLGDVVMASDKICQADADHRLFRPCRLGAELPIRLSWSVHIRTANPTVVTFNDIVMAADKICCIYQADADRRLFWCC